MIPLKKICIIYADNSGLINAISEYFNSREDLEITCLFIDDIQENMPENIKTHSITSELAVDFFEENKFDLVIISNFQKGFDRKIFNSSKFINVHPSLLPAFPNSEAIKEAYMAGVKVSGITIHSLEENPQNNKIIAQYPVLISNIMHFDEFYQSIKNLENNITPIVISKLLEDKIFDFQDLFGNNNHSCGGNCNGCGGCH